MSRYLNPSHGSKEEWLKANGKWIETAAMPANGITCVVLWDNGAFSAALAIESVGDLEDSQLEDDPRPRSYWAVPSELLADVT